MLKQSNIGRLISILHRNAQIFHNQNLKDLNISSSEFPFLLYLSDKNGVTQESVAQFYGMDKAAVTRILQSLEEKGFVLREKNKEDLRCNHIYLTDLATQTLPEIRTRVNLWSSYLNEDIDDDDIEKVLDVLSRMVEKSRLLEMEKTSHGV